ncbi:hypothetical protein DSL64_15620 [Dyadobacter luteus]|uniref:DUF202 domain-containing protein n=1 Tax=Dyadobacter luteus TaxID=2259619 RepID=A0A3D8Y9G5_9BACT|nr:DUF202 domain-containing protein [Dyadobacter luteus]REA60104.1 hypothetical protein DSL64_15620 [Dyadobacter luteus]
MNQESKPNHRQNAGDHLANERTFLAWIRTSIGIMGFGFVVVKFSLFTREISAVLAKRPQIEPTSYSPVIGVLLVAVGALVTLFSYVRYSNTKKQLEGEHYYHSSILIQTVTCVIFIASILLIVYLVKTT